MKHVIHSKLSVASWSCWFPLWFKSVKFFGGGGAVSRSCQSPMLVGRELVVSVGRVSRSCQSVMSVDAVRRYCESVVLFSF